MAPRFCGHLWKLPNTHLSDGSVIRVTLIGTKTKVWWWAERTALQRERLERAPSERHVPELRAMALRYGWGLSWSVMPKWHRTSLTRGSAHGQIIGFSSCSVHVSGSTGCPRISNMSGKGRSYGTWGGIWLDTGFHGHSRY